MFSCATDPKPSPAADPTPIPGEGIRPRDEIPGYSMDDLFANPEVRRRVGEVISKAARRPPSKP